MIYNDKEMDIIKKVDNLLKSAGFLYDTLSEKAKKNIYGEEEDSLGNYLHWAISASKYALETTTKEPPTCHLCGRKASSNISMDICDSCGKPTCHFCTDWNEESNTTLCVDCLEKEELSPETKKLIKQRLEGVKKGEVISTKELKKKLEKARVKK